MKKLLLLSLFTVTFSFGQSNSRDEWLQKEKIKQYDFLKNFKTTEYICETKDSVSLTYFIDSKKTLQKRENFFIGKKEIYKIIKSDDITSEINLCGPNDEPISYESNLNRYFCIINTHPDRKPPNTTHHKCLLDIDESYDSKNSKVYTLNCGKKSFKFNLTYGVIFDNDFGIGPYSSSNKTLKQGMSLSECYKTTP